jgi:hypothetical protein
MQKCNNNSITQICKRIILFPYWLIGLIIVRIIEAGITILKFCGKGIKYPLAIIGIIIVKIKYRKDPYF